MYTAANTNDIRKNLRLCANYLQKLVEPVKRKGNYNGKL